MEARFISLNITSYEAHKFQLMELLKDQDIYILALKEQRCHAEIPGFSNFFSHGSVGVGLHYKHGIVARRSGFITVLERSLAEDNFECVGAEFHTSAGPVAIFSLYVHPSLSFQQCLSGYEKIATFIEDNPRSILWVILTPLDVG